MPLYPFEGRWPKIDETAFIHPDAVVIGDVEIGPHSSLWPGVVARGDVNFIRIGSRSNIQDGSILHTTRPKPTNAAGYPLVIGDDITIGHRVTLHGCTLKDGCMVGMNAMVMDSVVVEEQAMIAAGAMVTPGKQVTRRTLWIGSPAREKRGMDEAAIAEISATTENYLRLAAQYRKELESLTER
uniref:Gamma carbonic anhydrase family protein n=1 Tax=Magnetococcus massalia (strain MO-1) TaxID=451514 RepID=A0A1S7LDK2_MAGMO|nr:conserved protein of unknown function [Include Bacterial transferase hexapeptide repeat] [Candidatus Magnetococcus massalia]